MILVVSLPDDPYAFPRNLLRGLKFCGLVAVHIVIALLGTAILESSLHRIFRPNSIATVLWKELILSATIAFGLGFSVQRLWQNTAAKWAWVLPALWFGFGTLLTVGHGAIFSQITGTACENGLGDPQCRRWFLFTIPLLRTGFYSVGASVQYIVGSTQGIASLTLTEATITRLLSKLVRVKVFNCALSALCLSV